VGRHDGVFESDSDEKEDKKEGDDDINDKLAVAAALANQRLHARVKVGERHV
jgi:hypothetical protein